MKQLQDWYNQICMIPSDINENLPHLYEYAQMCESVIEMGTREGVSIFAFAAAKPKFLRSIDLYRYPNATMLETACKEAGIDYEHQVGSTLEIEIPEVDLLFIDTEHSYAQLKAELALHGNKAKRYLAFHDTTTFGYEDSSSYGDQGLKPIDGKRGLMPAINEFLEENPHWVVDLVKENNNGMTFLKRVD
jgi:hypothetical protein